MLGAAVDPPKFETVSAFPPCKTLDRTIHKLRLSNSRLANLCFLSDISQACRATPNHPAKHTKPYEILHFAAFLFSGQRCLDLTHIAKFRKCMEVWPHAELVISNVLAIVYRHPINNLFEVSEFRKDRIVLDDLMNRMNMTNALLSNLCFLYDLGEYCHSLPPSHLAPTREQCHDLIHLSMFFGFSGMDMTHLSKFRNGHQLPWKSARYTLSYTLGMLQGEPLSEADLFPELLSFIEHGPLWPLFQEI